MTKGHAIQVLNHIMGENILDNKWVTLWAFGRRFLIENRNVDETPERKAERLSTRRKRTGTVGRPAEDQMDQGNATLLHSFPMLSNNPLAFGVLEHVYDLHTDEAITSRLPSPECYLGTLIGGKFVPHNNPSTAQIAESKRIIAARKKCVSARSAERLRRARVLGAKNKREREWKKSQQETSGRN